MIKEVRITLSPRNQLTGNITAVRDGTRCVTAMTMHCVFNCITGIV